jgi:hypothetical protein
MLSSQLIRNFSTLENALLIGCTAIVFFQRHKRIMDYRIVQLTVSRSLDCIVIVLDKFITL